MKKAVSKALLLAVAATSAYASPDEYEKKSAEKYADGVILEILKEVPAALGAFYDALAVDQKVEITVKDIDGRDIQKTLRYSIDGFIGENTQSQGYYYRSHSEPRMGGFPFALSITAEDGSEISIEEARLGLVQVQDQDSGLTAMILEYAIDNDMDFSTEVMQEAETIDFLNIRIADSLHSFDNGTRILFNGYAKVGLLQNLKSYGITNKAGFSDTNKIEYGSSLGVKFKDVIKNVSITPEFFYKSADLYKANDLSVARSGFQVSFETFFDKHFACSAAIGIATEKVTGNYVEKRDEVFLGTKCEF